MSEDGVQVSLMKLNKIHPIPHEAIKIISEFPVVFAFEECIKNGCVSQQILAQLSGMGYHGSFHITAIDDCFVPQAKVERCLEWLELDSDSIYRKVKNETEKRT